MANSIIRLSESSFNNTALYSNIKKLNLNDQHIIVIPADKKILDAIRSSLSTVSYINADAAETVKFVYKNISSLYEGLGLKVSDIANALTKELETLLLGINYTGSLSLSLKDQAISYADKITALAFSECLKDKAIENTLVYPETIGLAVNEDYGNANVMFDESKQNINWDHFSSLTVIPGSYGVNKHGKTTRMGYKAADYTSAALSSILNVMQIELWDMDNPFKTVNIDSISDAAYIEQLSFSEASEMAYFKKSTSIHPRIVDPLYGTGATILVYELTENDKKLRTTIKEEQTISRNVVKSIASSDDIVIFKLVGPAVGFKPGILAQVTTALHHKGVNIRSVITAQTSINILISKEYKDIASSLVQELDLPSVNKLTIESDISLIAVIGHGMQMNHGISAALFNALSNKKTNVILSGSGASDLVSYIVVEKNKSQGAIEEIYKTFFCNC